MGNNHSHRKKKDYNTNKIENTIQQNEYPKGVVIKKSSQFQIYYHSAHYYYNPYMNFHIDIDVDRVNNLVIVTNTLSENVQNLFLAISKFKNLDSLQLKLGPCNYLRNSDIVELANQIEILQNLKDLKIDFSSNFKLDKLDGEDQSNLGVSKLAKAISSFGKLKNLEMNFESCQLRDQSLSDFLDGLYTSKIESLSLNLSNSMISEKAGYSLAMLLNNQQGLIEKLRLKIVLTKIKDEFFEQFFKFIKIGHFKLKVFGISIASCEMNKSIISENMLGNFLKLNMSIEDFSLNIQNNQVNDGEITQFIDSLTSHSSIKKLKLNFSNNKITKKDTLEYIGKSLAKMDKLTHLNLQFESLNIEIPKEILQTINLNKNLHTLQLFLSQNIISHEFINSLHEVFSQDISSLKALEIDIGQKSIDKISDHLCSFIRCLNSSKSLELQVLKLYFPTAFADTLALEQQLSQMKVSIHTLHLKVSQQNFPSIMRGLRDSNICELFIQDVKSNQPMNDTNFVKAFIQLVSQNQSLTRLYIKGSGDNSLYLPDYYKDQFQLCLYSSQKLIDTWFIKGETGSDKLCELQSYKIILERRSIFCLVVAFIRNCIDQIPVNPYHVFWDLYLD
ncbi:hypothetical protein TTHERM_00138030 (macronuclear) [Tetrahymena thermophila SB210]|uniref:Kinase domain protein n=1 Tax=Tetrahymena thermophila (strain SB210) TaxID=312017 RepID=I7MFA1_TETTS|nr:hypothetical protein TTHERM_00138030 [Tetrahymena thermophila SB210]EAR99540.2 hypothetical protein TTHERM_00138030 [Tetrahymena thermophila SB210]|eukprot:XP_001019785.2 hypothetical protein TTHERM_00138030 [Tetrahymena thermophila SB210]